MEAWTISPIKYSDKENLIIFTKEQALKVDEQKLNEVIIKDIQIKLTHLKLFEKEMLLDFDVSKSYRLNLNQMTLDVNTSLPPIVQCLIGTSVWLTVTQLALLEAKPWQSQ